MGAYKIRIDSIYCAAQKDAKGNAEVWLLAQSDGGAPVRYPQAAMSSHSMDVGDTWEIGDLVLEFDGCCNLTIYEQDLGLDVNLTDFMGCARFTSGADASTAKVATNGTDSGEHDYSKFTIQFSWAS